MIRRHDLDLENKCFYRLVKVMYVFFLAIGFSAIFYLGSTLIAEKPNSSVDTFTKKKLPLRNEHERDSVNKSFEEKNRAAGLPLEKDKHQSTVAGSAHTLAEPTHGYQPTDADLAYLDSLIYRDSWISAIKCCSFGGLVIFLIFNLLKQSLLYIVYGKKFGVPVISGSRKCWR